ncbi:oxidoreductase domain containing protein [Teratosphaeria destructans]|uniref:Oxidoreductase domain containing protein n=1 Tax=Teratosphaeria destructans TaxID=418781 RepID=A0A9W7W457_9PEZI|nr:oxidoreductase domain containing protein [Teratosphaeria destructans]
MDDFAFQQELEALAGNAFDPDARTTEPIVQTAARWQRLFGLPQDEAIERIVEHRNSLTGVRITDDHWETIRTEKEGEGYDREAYEYEVNLQREKALLPGLVPAASDAVDDSTVTYLVDLVGPLATPQKVQVAAGLEKAPDVVEGHSVEESRAVRLCCIDGRAKNAILRWASTEGDGYEPVILVDPRSLR